MLAEHDVGAGRAHRLGRMPLTVACVPTGMKAGVATAPCGVPISPRRAAPSVAMSSKEKTSAMLRGRCQDELAEQEAGIAVGVEPVAGGDGVRIGALHRVEAAERRDQHEQGRARQVEVGQHHVDRAKAVARRDEQGGLARERTGPRRPRSLALSSRRSGSSRPRRCGRPRAAHALSAAAISALTLPYSGCIRCPAVSAAFTGRKVPAPTCSVTLCRAMPRSASRASSASVKCSPAVGAATDPSACANMVW